jgi:hypothetical protein
VSWWSDLVQAVAEGAAGVPAPANAPAISAGTPLVQAGGVIPVMEGMWAGLTDGKFWRSLGWLLLGVLLMLLGAGWWIGPKAAAAMPPAVP